MSKEVRRTVALLKLLEEYVHVAGLWEDYYRAANNNEMNTEEQRTAQAHIQRAYMIPLMDECRKQGFKYADLIDMIPTAFKTDKAERKRILADLHLWAQEEHGLQRNTGDETCQM